MVVGLITLFPLSYLKNFHEVALGVLPRKIKEKSKERYISQFLSNFRIKPLGVMRGFIAELVEVMGADEKVVILMLEQSNTKLRTK
jgi:hypothetical protein